MNRSHLGTLDCGCNAYESNATWNDSPALQLEPCDRHNKAWMEFDGKTFDKEY